MARLSRLLSLRFGAVLAALCAPVMALAEADVSTKELRARLKVVEARSADAPLRAVDVAALRAELGLGQAPDQAPQAGFGGAGGLFSLASVQPQPAQASAASGKPMDVSTTNFRLMLATLAQTHTGVNNLSVVNAQGPRGPVALSVRSGRVSLADIQALSAQQGFAPRADGTLTAPVLLWKDATLVLRPGERLAFDRASGAFLLSMGRIDIDGALIEAVGSDNPYEENFRPFITVLSGGALVMRNATVRGLGFGRSNKFAGLTIAGNPLMQSDAEVVIENSLFEDIKIVTVSGTADAVVSGNTFQNARSNALNISAAPRAQITQNLFRGASPTNAIRVELGSDRAVIEKNVFLAGARVAILVQGGSGHVAVKDNLIWRRDGAGIKFLNARCGRAEGNLLLDNQQKGIEVRKSDGVVVANNLLAGNRSAGVWVSAQAGDAQTSVNGNRFEGNGSGLSAATGAVIWVAQNNFKRQLPKVLDGDIARLSTAVVRALEGTGPLRFADGQSQAKDTLAALCGGDA